MSDLLVRRSGQWRFRKNGTAVADSAAPVGSVLISDDGSGSTTASYTNQIDPVWFVENAGYSITRANGIVKNDSPTNFRMWTKQAVGGPGQDISIKYRIRATQITPDADGVTEGVKFQIKWVAPIHNGPNGSDGTPQSNPDNARGIDPWWNNPPTNTISQTPGSMFYTIMTTNGAEGEETLSKRPWGAGTSDYVFPVFRNDGNYTVGTWVDVEITLEWLTNPNALRMRCYRNGVLDMEYTDSNPPGTLPANGGEAFMWKCFPSVRADDSLFELDSFSVEELSAATVLWSSDDTQTTPAAAYDLNYIQSGTNYAGRGSMVDGRLRAVIGPEADLGFRAHSENPAGSPLNSTVLTYNFRVPQLGGLNAVIAKVGLGLVGAAPAATSQNEMSTGGIKRADAWSARTSWTPANYLAWQARYPDHPVTLTAYLYAFKAGGLEIATYNGGYGLEFLYIDPQGNFFSPVQGQEYEHKIEWHNNTPGIADGIYRAWVDGVLYVDLSDIQWNESVDRPFNYLMFQGFANDPLNPATAAHYEVSNATLEAI